jgi:hypothetical protein
MAFVSYGFVLVRVRTGGEGSGEEANIILIKKSINMGLLMDFSLIWALLIPIPPLLMTQR